MTGVINAKLVRLNTSSIRVLFPTPFIHNTISQCRIVISNCSFCSFSTSARVHVHFDYTSTSDLSRCVASASSLSFPSLPIHTPKTSLLAVWLTPIHIPLFMLSVTTNLFTLKVFFIQLNLSHWARRITLAKKVHYSLDYTGRLY